MKTFHECGLLLLAIVGLFLASCGKTSFPENEREAMDNEELSEQIVHCRSSVDGMPLRCTLRFPSDYDFAHPRPLIVVMPEMSLAGEWQAGQALVARIENTRPKECPSWLIHEDVRTAIDYLCDNFPVKRNQIYLAANGISGCGFACMNAQRFAGIYLQLEDTVFDKWEELPWKNLLDVPVFLHNDNFSPVATELQQRLLRAGARYLNAPEFLLTTTPTDGVVQAFAWLSAQKVSRDCISWEGSRTMPREAWWLRADAIADGAQMAAMTAKYDRESKRIYLYTKNIGMLSVDTGWEGFKGCMSLDLEIDGCIFPIPVTGGLVQVEKDVDNSWDFAAKRHKDAMRTDFSMHGLRSILSRPVLLVYGSANGEREEAWSAAADGFADAWQSRTGCRPEVCADHAISPEVLENRNLVFFGSPADNSLTEALLQNDASFLRRLYDCLKGDSRQNDDLTCVTLYPDDTFSKDGIAAIVLANDITGIADSWRVLLEAPEADFVFQDKSGKFEGYLSDDWEIEE